MSNYKYSNDHRELSTFPLTDDHRKIIDDLIADGLITAPGWSTVNTPIGENGISLEKALEDLQKMSISGLSQSIDEIRKARGLD